MLCLSNIVLNAHPLSVFDLYDDAPNVGLFIRLYFRRDWRLAVGMARDLMEALKPGPVPELVKFKLVS